MIISAGNLSDGANHAWLTATFASTGVEVQEIVMVPDKATGIAKGSAFVFVPGKKVPNTTAYLSSNRKHVTRFRRMRKDSFCCCTSVWRVPMLPRYS